MIRFSPLLLLFSFLLPVALTAQEEESAPEAKPNPAVEFLRKMERKNEGVDTLRAKFFQVRRNVMFDEKYESAGEFWYSKPDKFRCDYENPSPAEFYLVDQTGYFYTPENLHVEKFTVPGGEKAPIHGMLVGFGVSVDKILEVFDVTLAAEQPKKKSEIAIEFRSEDLQRSLDYTEIKIVFDEKHLEPLRLVMEEKTEDIVEIDIKKIETNVEIAEEMFEPQFPEDATMTEVN